MKKRSAFAILLAMFFLVITLNVFSENDNTSNSGQATGSGGDIHGISSADVNGVFVPE
jgi:hypothetical protein